MSFASQRRYRPGRGAIGQTPGLAAKLWEKLHRGDVLIRLALCLAAAAAMWLISGGWQPLLRYRPGFIPHRDLVARVDFRVYDQSKTESLRAEARRNVECIYDNNPEPLEQLRRQLIDRLADLLTADSFDKVDPKKWAEFAAPDAPSGDAARFNALRDYYKQKGMTGDRFEKALKDAIAPFELLGMLQEHNPPEGSPSQIRVRLSGHGAQQAVPVSEVRINNLKIKLKEHLRKEFSEEMPGGVNSGQVADLVYAWLDSRLPITLKMDVAATKREADKVAQEVLPQEHLYQSGIDKIVPAGKPLGAAELLLLEKEHEQWVAQLGWPQKLNFSLAKFGMYLALYVLCGSYIYNRNRLILTDLRRFVTLLGAVVATLLFCRLASVGAWSAQIIPLMLFGMTAAIAYEKELALLLAASVSLIVAFSMEQGLAEFVILVSSVASAILLLRRIRSRTKLIYVGAVSGAVVMLTTIGVGTMVRQTFGSPDSALRVTGVAAETLGDVFTPTLLAGAAWFGFCSLLSGLLMTGLLPFIERMFDVQTDISLLELGDVQHPLLQELVRRAPGTYNHSINVASIAENAAEAINANGLLVRVGAYFHDIGKMLKPSYFVENQGADGNRHESLQPAMSTLVIIAHVKDGADLARQHHLPQSIIDFIEQHHGTTLVEFFYRREAKRIEADPDAAELDESTFRYPGPKPQHKETAVLMLADVVESASRALTDPTPSRIESLVHDLAMKRLLDGQFDECGLTLQELRTIEDSLVKSLTAVYHGRVRYPEHQTV